MLNLALSQLFRHELVEINVASHRFSLLVTMNSHQKIQASIRELNTRYEYSLSSDYLTQKRAGMVLSEAKKSGRNCYVLYEEDLSRGV